MNQTSGCFSIERHVRSLRDSDTVKQDGELTRDSDDCTVARLLASAFRQVQAPPSQRGVLSSRSKDMVPALDQEGSQVDVACLGDAELRVSVSRLAASRPQAEIAAHVTTSLEALLVA